MFVTKQGGPLDTFLIGYTLGLIPSIPFYYQAETGLLLYTNNSYSKKNTQHNGYTFEDNTSVYFRLNFFLAAPLLAKRPPDLRFLALGSLKKLFSPK